MYVQTLPPLSFIQAIRACCRKCWRARRSEYWYLILFYAIVMSWLSLLFFFLFLVLLADDINSKHFNINQYNESSFYALIYSLLTFMIVINFIFIIPLIPAKIRMILPFKLCSFRRYCSFIVFAWRFSTKWK